MFFSKYREIVNSWKNFVHKVLGEASTGGIKIEGQYYFPCNIKLEKMEMQDDGPT